MKIGDIIEVFEDPLTKRRSNGLARLLCKLHVIYEGEAEYWKVKFIKNNEIEDRIIYTP